MKWKGQRQSSNVEDRRGTGMRIGGRGIGLGTIVIALIAGWLFGINPLTVLGLLGGGMEIPVTQESAAPPPADDQQAAFVSTVLADTEDVWRALFAAGGQQYQEPKLVLFRGYVGTACGTGQSAMGPFYCPGDMKVYLDLDFFDTLYRQLGAPGDFAQAYVIAHEIGHHVQRLVGVTEQVDQLRGRVAEREMNVMSVRVELQADCYAGVWGHDAASRLQVTDDDVREALVAANAIGDDRLQKQAQGYAVPDSFTHGTSEQRQRWFSTGFRTGDPKACDTFNAAQL